MTPETLPVASEPDRSTRAFSLKDHRRRYRQETVDAILATAREVMREQGVSALNLNEVARRLGVSGQALAKYFPNKLALYDALSLLGHRLFREHEARVLSATAPNWERIHQWFAGRFALACEHPDLYALIWGGSVPGYIPSEAVGVEISAMLTDARQGIGEVIEAGVLDAALPVERVVDILLAVRHGVIAEHLAKRSHLPPAESDRFSGLIPDVLAVFEQAWKPRRAQSRRAKTAAANMKDGALETIQQEGGPTPPRE